MAAVNVTFPGNLAQVKTAADLRSVPSTLLPLGALFLVNGLEGLFEYDPGSLAPDDGKDVLRPVDKTPGQVGRWIRNVDGLATGPEGPTGPANSTYTSLGALKAAPQSNRSYILADGSNSPVTYAYVAGDFTGRADDVNVVKLDTVPLATGALVRQTAESLAFKQKGAAGFTAGDTALNAFAVPAQFPANTDSSRLQSLLNSGRKLILIPEGEYILTESVILPGNARIIAPAGAIFKAGVNGLAMFATTGNTFGTSWTGGVFDGSGKTGVNAFDLVGFRNAGAAINFISCVNLNVGVYLRELCWDLIIDSPYMQGVVDGIVIGPRGGTNAVQIRHPAINGFSSTGITVAAGDGATLPNVVNQIEGGYIQGGPIGILDLGTGTVISKTYFEDCSVADVSLSGAILPQVWSTYHSSPLGSVCIKGVNVKGGAIRYPMYIGDRSFGMFNFDATNTRCVATIQTTLEGLNAPTGDFTGLKVNNSLTGNPEFGDIGVNTSLANQPTAAIGVDFGSLHQRQIANGYDAILVGPGLNINAQQQSGSAYSFTGNGAAITVSGLGGGALRQSFHLFVKWVGTAGTMTVNGVLIDMTGVADGKRAWIEVTKIDADGGASYVRSSGWQ